MSNLVECPTCYRQLRVPDELLGSEVRCPKCEAVFTAKNESAPPQVSDQITEQASLAVPQREPQSSDRPITPQPRRRWEDEPDEGDERPWEQPRRYGPRRDMEIHRGTMILTFGIVSIVAATGGACLAGLFSEAIAIGMGITAIVLGQIDRRKIQAGLMDPDGSSQTNTGWILGIIGTSIGGVIVLIFVGILVIAFSLK